jgi:hypothetical protein
MWNQSPAMMKVTSSLVETSPAPAAPEGWSPRNATTWRCHGHDTRGTSRRLSRVAPMGHMRHRIPSPLRISSTVANVPSRVDPRAMGDGKMPASIVRAGGGRRAAFPVLPAFSAEELDAVDRRGQFRHFYRASILAAQKLRTTPTK